MKIKRRILKDKSNPVKGYKTIVQRAEFIRENKKTIWVMLKHGDVIKRKKEDIIYDKDKQRRFKKRYSTNRV